MAKEWVIIANHTQAKIFSNDENPATLKFVRLIPNDYNVPREYQFQNDQTAIEQAAKEFCNQLASVLKKDKEEKMFERLTVCAEPHMMGRLKAAINGWAKDTPISWFNRDLIHLSTDQLDQHLRTEALKENPLPSL